MALHAYVDESDRGRRDYLVCVSIVDTKVADARRGTLRGLLLPGMPRFHMKNENDRLKKAMLSAVEGAGTRNLIYEAAHRVRREGLAEILRDMVSELEVDRLVLESRGAQDHEDRQVLHDMVVKGWQGGRLLLHPSVSWVGATPVDSRCDRMGVREGRRLAAPSNGVSQ